MHTRQMRGNGIAVAACRRRGEEVGEKTGQEDGSTGTYRHGVLEAVRRRRRFCSYR